MEAQQGEETIGPYTIEATIGVGGMGTVYRVQERATGRVLALKRLVLVGARKPERLLELFEREYYTLAQLSHPAVIEVHDYGVDPGGAYYAMELLDGEQLNRCRALPIPEVCAILYGVASCLSLLHARRLLHRDVTGRNIIVTGPGEAKLIDFGALCPMGPAAVLVGTPTHIAPEAVLMQSLDGRADLYALGVVAYQALTGRYPYRARSVEALRGLWESPPLSPLQLRAEVPPALSELVMSLLSLDRDARPRDATEVMEKLAALGGLPVDAESASHAHLVTPPLVGREETTRKIRSLLSDALSGRGRSVVLRGPAGVGRSRMLEATVLEAKLRGATVLRLDARTDSEGDFAAADRGLRQLQALSAVRFDTLQRAFEATATSPEAPAGEAAGQGRGRSSRPPRSSPPSARELARTQAIARFVQVMCGYAEDEALVLVADDLHLLDEPSIAAIATALQQVAGRRMLFVGTLPAEEAEADTGAGLGRRLLLQRSGQVELAPLGARATRELTRGMFGSVPHVGALAARLHRISRGYPRDLFALAEHLLATGVITYRAGSFELPPEVPDDALPGSLAEALQQRVAALAPLARALAQAQALGGRRAITFSEARALFPKADAAALRGALDALVAADVFVAGETGYALRHSAWAAALDRSLGEAQRRESHRALVGMLVGSGGDTLWQAHHALQAGDVEQALSLVAGFASEHAERGAELFELTSLSHRRLLALLSRVSALLVARDGPMLSIVQLRYMLMTIGALVDAAVFFEHAPAVEAQLKRDSGWDDFHRLDPDMEPMARVLEAIGRAQADYEADPEARPLAPADAIRHLVMHAVAGIAVGARSMDAPLRQRLPALLAPFVPLSPIVAAMHQNCLSSAESATADYEHAAGRLVEVVAALGSSAGAEQEHAEEIRAACIYALAAYRARLGIPDHERLLELIADHPRQASNALRVRAMCALEAGDWEAAERYSQAAEQHDMEHDSPPMFGLVAVVGMLQPYARGLDLSTVGKLLAIIRPQAAHAEGWQTALHGALGEYHRLRGDHTAALAELDACARRCEPASPRQHPLSHWYVAEASALEILLEQGELDACRARAERALRWGGGKPEGARYDGVERALALCEGRAGDHAGAHRRIDRLIAYREAIGTRGLQLGLLHEARALLSMAEGDSARAWDAYARARDEMVGEGRTGLLRRVTRLRELLQRGSGELQRADVTAVGAGDGADLRRRAERGIVAGLGMGHGAEAQVSEALAQLCRCMGSHAGHLYALRGGKPRWVAGQGVDGAPAGLRSHVAAQWALEQEAERGLDPSVTTGATREGRRSESLDTSTWIDTDGAQPLCYRLIWVRGESGASASDSPPVAVVALGDPPDTDSSRTRVML